MVIIPQLLENIPQELRDLSQWVCWQIMERGGKPTKIPIDPNNRKFASVTDRNTWADFHTALKMAKTNPNWGVGFVLTESDGLLAIDLDNCLDEQGELNPAAKRLVKTLDSYSEFSPSGRGVHIWCFANLPNGRSGTRKPGVEIYSSKRFICMTGRRLEGSPTTIHHRQDEIENVFAHISGNDEEKTPDLKLLELAMSAENGAKFRRLWYSQDAAGYASPSEADCALANMLLFWTGGDIQRAERLFSLSVRGQREKWQSRPDYREMTMRAALKGKTEFYRAGDAQSSKFEQLAPRSAISLRELMAKEFAPTVYLVPNVLPEGGLTLLAGRPKVGKSWFALQVACALSSGGFALGLNAPLPKRKVLYCALEDSLRRLQQRIKLVGTTYDPDAFHIVTELSPLDRGGADELRQLIRDTGASIVVLDVAVKILPRRRRNDGVYQHDYDAFAQLKDIAAAEDITLVCLHHESKAPHEDPLMRVSGSTGLTGAVDTVLTLSKKRGEQTATLFVTGRDIEREGEYALSFTAGKWYMEGDAHVVRMSEERRQILQAIEDLGGKATPRQIATHLVRNASTIRNMLRKMLDSGHVTCEGGYYKHTIDTIDSVNATNASQLSTVSTPSPLTMVTMVSTQVDGGANIPSIFPMPSGMSAWCDVCNCSMLHVGNKEGSWRCVGCETCRTLKF